MNFLKCLIRPGGGNLRAQLTAVIRIFGDVKFVSNIFHITLNFVESFRESEMVKISSLSRNETGDGERVPAKQIKKPECLGHPCESQNPKQCLECELFYLFYHKFYV